MKEEDIKRLTALLDERTMKLMERESELADQMEELAAQKEELTAAVEELMSKNKELQDRNQELDQLLYRSSHDLRSPVTSMFGVLNLLKSAPIPPDFQVYCDHFEKMMKQMNAVVNTLDQLGKSTLEDILLEPLSVRSLIDECIQQLSHLPNFPHIQFTATHEGLDVIQSDQQLLHIMLQCLLSNAVIFREPKPGTVQIRTSASSRELSLEIIDDGEGISDSVAPHIFNMFYRGSEKSTGQGMGLYLVKKIVWRLRGDLTWSSAGGHTTFRILIPVAPAPAS